MRRSRDPYALSDDDDELTAAAVATATAAAESLWQFFSYHSNRDNI